MIQAEKEREKKVLVEKTRTENDTKKEGIKFLIESLLFVTKYCSTPLLNPGRWLPVKWEKWMSRQAEGKYAKRR